MHSSYSSVYRLAAVATVTAVLHGTGCSDRTLDTAETVASDTMSPGETTGMTGPDGADNEESESSDNGSGSGDGDGDGDGSEPIPPECQDLPIADPEMPVAPDDKAFQFEGFDRHGETFNIASLCGAPFMILLSWTWCGPCNELGAALLPDGAWESVAEPCRSDTDAIRAQLETGELEFVEVLMEDDVGQHPTVETLESWYEAFPNEHMILIGDPTPDGEASPLDPLIVTDGCSGAIPCTAYVDQDYFFRAIDHPCEVFATYLE